MNADKNLILPEYRIDLLNKNKKIINKIENIEKEQKNFIKQDYKRKSFKKKKYSNKFKKKYNYHSKERKYNFENKKFARY